MLVLNYIVRYLFLPLSFHPRIIKYSPGHVLIPFPSLALRTLSLCMFAE